MTYAKWIKLNTSDLTNKTVAITGSTGGLGNEIVKILAKLNCNLILLNRNSNKSNKQKEELIKLNKNIKIEILELDLCNFKQVKTITQTLKQRQIDFFIHNAAIYNVPIYKTESGFNNVFQTNFVSPYYITKELLSNFNTSNSKVIIVGSIAHNYNKLNENDIDFSHSKKHSHIYGNSKRFLTYSLFKLFEKENLLNLSVTNPGITLTNITNHYPKAINWFVKLGIKLIFPTPKNACLNIVKGLFDNTSNNEWITPKLFNIWGRPTKKVINNYNNQEADKIFEISESIYNKIKD